MRISIITLLAILALGGIAAPAIAQTSSAPPAAQTSDPRPIAPSGANELARALSCANHDPAVTGAFERWTASAHEWVDTAAQMTRHNHNLMQWYARRLSPGAPQTAQNDPGMQSLVEHDPDRIARISQIRVLLNTILDDLVEITSSTSTDRAAVCAQIDLAIERMEEATALFNQHWQAIDAAYIAASRSTISPQTEALPARF